MYLAPIEEIEKGSWDDAVDAVISLASNLCSSPLRERNIRKKQRQPGTLETCSIWTISSVTFPLGPKCIRNFASSFFAQHLLCRIIIENQMLGFHLSLVWSVVSKKQTNKERRENISKRQNRRRAQLIYIWDTVAMSPMPSSVRLIYFYFE